MDREFGVIVRIFDAGIVGTITSSKHAFLVVLELHNERLDVLALSLPVLDALLSVAVEVLLLLIDKGLSLESIRLRLLELLNGNSVLDVRLVLLEVEKLSGTLAIFFLLLLFSHLQLFVAHLPEVSKVMLLLFHGSFLSLFPADLKLTAPLDCSLHLSLALLLLLVESVSAILSLGNLPVEHLLLVVLEGTELLNLRVDHALPSVLLITEALVLTVLLHILKFLALLSKGLNFLLLFDLLQAFRFFHSEELAVSLSQVGAHLGDLLLAHDFALLFALQVFLNLPLDEFALEHLFFQRLDEAELEVLELLADVFCVRLFKQVLLLELGAHLFVVLVHLLTLNFFPVSTNVLLNRLFA